MIRVIIERTVAPGLEHAYEQAVRKTLANAVARPGFISGESLCDLKKPNHHVVLCSWRSEREWNEWFASRERRECFAAVRPMLETDESITLLSMA